MRPGISSPGRMSAVSAQLSAGGKDDGGGYGRINYHVRAGLPFGSPALHVESFSYTADCSFTLRTSGAYYSLSSGVTRKNPRKARGCGQNPGLIPDRLSTLCCATSCHPLLLANLISVYVQERNPHLFGQWYHMIDIRICRDFDFRQDTAGRALNQYLFTIFVIDQKYAFPPPDGMLYINSI